ncbi:MAG TPA: tetratricopeptide repeat protein [Candidatus Dormibacteraeota bacterium]|nr:tetratricopeptide repeat protein [Candidatus Dormibacteraeota bacterium]
MLSEAGRLPPGNLPVRLDKLIGRDSEVEQLQRLSEKHRLVTLTGPGGVGKTSLAIAVAAERARKLKHGAWFCDLAATSDPSLVPNAVAGALGAPEQPGAPVMEAIGSWISDRSLLLVLDNCEHLASACATLAESLLSAYPGLRLIATSRETLDARGEVVWTVNPLMVPDAASGPARVIARSPAVQLFVERAAQARPGFELDAGNAAAIATMCRRLDGIPLALELCAARIRMMPPEEILHRLEERIDVLGGRNRPGPERQRTVRASIDWSYGLLSDAERALFRRLAIFAGTFDIDGMAAVCHGGPVPDDALATFAALVDKSLVSTSPSVRGRARYRLLEVIREFAVEKLHENREWEPLRARHAGHFLAVAEESNSQLDLADQDLWLDRMRADLDNFRAGLDWAQLADPAVLPRLATAVSPFLQIAGHYRESRRWLSSALDVEREPTALRDRILAELGNTAWRLGDFVFARRCLEEAVAIARRRDDKTRLAIDLGGLGFVRFGTDDFRQAGPLFEEAVRLSRETGDRVVLAQSLQDTGILALQLGLADEAHDRYREALAIFKEIGHVRGIAYCSQQVALASIQRGDLQGAEAAIRDAVPLQVRLGTPAGVAGALYIAAELDAVRGRLERAMLIAGAANARYSASGSHVPSLQKASRDRWFPTAQRKLGAKGRVLFEKGARFTDEQVASLVVSGEDLPELGNLRNGEEALTDRERQVAELLARGLTNRQIASRLHVSERTVDAHAEHIRGKLGVHSRAQIAVWINQNRRGD